MNMIKPCTYTMLTLLFLNSAGLNVLAQDDLYTANGNTGVREYIVSEGTEYLIRSLGETGSGIFYVRGSGANSILSGKINGSDDNKGSFFQLTAPHNTQLNLSNLTITDAATIGKAGSVITITNGYSANLSGVTIKDILSREFGAIYVIDGYINIDNCNFESIDSHTSALVHGLSGQMTITNSLFKNNTSVEGGGAIQNVTDRNKINIDSNSLKEDLVITNSKFIENRTNGSFGSTGGAIRNDHTITINSSEFRGNTATINGGALSSVLTANINDTLFYSNKAEFGDGGAIFGEDIVSVTGGSAFINNYAHGNGGAICSWHDINLTSNENGDIIFQNNQAGPILNDIHVERTLTINGNTNSVIISGGISGRGKIIKTNEGNLILHGDNSRSKGGFQQDGGTTAISDGTWFSGNSTISGGRLEWGPNTLKGTGSLGITKGSLYVHPNAVLDLNNIGDSIDADAVVYLDTKGVIKNNGTIVFNKDDTLLGTIENEKSLTLDNIIVNSANISHKDGDLNMQNNAIVALNPTAGISGGNMTIDSGSILNMPYNSFNVNNLNMNNGTINALNNQINTNYIANTFTVGANGAHFGVDFNPEKGTSDQFIADNITGTGNISIDNYNIVGAPVEQKIPFPVFISNQDKDLTYKANGVTYSATNATFDTPLYKYNLVSEGDGLFSLNRKEINPAVFRGAETSEAMFLNNMLVTDMIFDHVYIDSEKLNKLGNKNSSNMFYAPFQQVDNDEGSIWYKPYISYDRFSLTNNNMIYNTAYGAILGFDFPTQKLNEEWNFLPTAFITYQGAAQSSRNDRYYQNGGMGGLMGTVFRKDWVSSFLAYGGGYNNQMQGNGFNDTTDNWYAGCAAISAYNFHPKKNIIIQPNVWAGYNIIGKQNWRSDVNNINMATGYLNGLVAAPGLNVFYGGDTWSVYGTVNYLLTINDQVTAKAGNFQQESAKLNYGFLQYGVGFIKNFKDRLFACGQITIRNGGATGIGFWGGITYKF